MSANGFHGLNPAKVDELDQQIIRLLQEDGRRSATEMARLVGLSHAAVGQRIQRLLAENIVSIAAMTHPETHGYRQSALVGISVDTRIHEAASALAEMDEIYYLVTATGRYDIVAEVMAADSDHLIEIIMQIRGVVGVKHTETITFVNTVKWEYAPGFDALANSADNT